MAYSDAISTMLNLLSSFTDDKMIPKPITVHNNFIIILSQYIIFSRNVCYTLYITYISQQECRGVLELECTINIKAISPPKDYCIHSFWSQHTEKRNTTVSQMRLRSVFKMRMSILGTATTEQMGYGSISFFDCFL